jgi:IS5 family transposase
MPIDPLSLMCWRKRVGKGDVETLLVTNIGAARRGGVIRTASVQQVIVGTTVMHAQGYRPFSRQPTNCSTKVDSTCKGGEEHGLRLRQNYNCVALHLVAQIGRYAHAKQFKYIEKTVCTLCARVGLVPCEVVHQLHLPPKATKAKKEGLVASKHAPCTALCRAVPMTATCWARAISVWKLKECALRIFCDHFGGSWWRS